MKIIIALILPLVAIAYADHNQDVYDEEHPKCTMITNGTHNQTCVTKYEKQMHSCVEDIHDLSHSLDSQISLTSELSTDYRTCRQAMTELESGEEVYNYLIKIRITQAANHVLTNDLISANKNIDRLNEQITNMTKQIKDIQKENKALKQDIRERNYC